MINIFETETFKIFESDYSKFLTENDVKNEKEKFRLFVYCQLSYIEKYLLLTLLFDEFDGIYETLADKILEMKENIDDFKMILDFCIRRSKRVKFCNSKFNRIFRKKKVLKERNELKEEITKEKNIIKERLKEFPYKYDTLLSKRSWKRLWDLK